MQRYSKHHDDVQRVDGHHQSNERHLCHPAGRRESQSHPDTLPTHQCQGDIHFPRCGAACHKYSVFSSLPLSLLLSLFLPFSPSSIPFLSPSPLLSPLPPLSLLLSLYLPFSPSSLPSLSPSSFSPSLSPLPPPSLLLSGNLL